MILLTDLKAQLTKDNGQPLEILGRSIEPLG